MKFENIKVGDEVLIDYDLRITMSRGETYYVAEEVVKVTKTQFTTSTGKRFKKDAGTEIGSFSYHNKRHTAKHVGEKFERHGNVLRVYNDQTVEYMQRSKEVKLYQKNISTIYDYGCSIYRWAGNGFLELSEEQKKTIEQIAMTLKETFPEAV